MNHLCERITDLARLMDEFDIEQASLKGDDWLIAFSRHGESNVSAASHSGQSIEHRSTVRTTPKKLSTVEDRSMGTPITSPMTGIFYRSSSPGADPFVKDGDVVTAGQVVGLIEAMKVFNEIVAPSAGTVTKVVAQNGQLIQPGEVLLYIT